jgi:hypothetical protein
VDDRDRPASTRWTASRRLARRPGADLSTRQKIWCSPPERPSLTEFLTEYDRPTDGPQRNRRTGSTSFCGREQRRRTTDQRTDDQRRATDLAVGGSNPSRRALTSSFAAPEAAPRLCRRCADPGATSAACATKDRSPCHQLAAWFEFLQGPGRAGQLAVQEGHGHLARAAHGHVRSGRKESEAERPGRVASSTAERASLVMLADRIRLCSKARAQDAHSMGWWPSPSCPGQASAHVGTDGQTGPCCPGGQHACPQDADRALRRGSP